MLTSVQGSGDRVGAGGEEKEALGGSWTCTGSQSPGGQLLSPGGIPVIHQAARDRRQVSRCVFLAN